MARPVIGVEYAPFYDTYVQYTSLDEVVEELLVSETELADYLPTLPPNKAGYAYAPGKWTVAQLLQHMIDTERVFAYRAMCIARGESQSLPGFDENAYAEAAPAAHRPLADLQAELLLVRRSSVMLFKSLLPTQLAHIGTASGKPISVNALGYIMVGHVLHHINVLKERYLDT